MTGIRVIESSDSKSVALLGTNLFSFVGDKFCEVVTYNESSMQFIIIEVGLERSRELLNITFVM